MKELTKEEKQLRIAQNVAAVINEDPFYKIINLGVGIPTTAADYITRQNVYILAENGMLGVGPLAVGGQVHPDRINASRQPVQETPGCCYCDSSMSFGMIRGGHVDATVLGAFEVDQKANVANWIIPGGKQLGVGGAMDLVSGARRVILAMTHTSRTGSKLVKKCTLPITAQGKVNIVVTEYGVFAFENGQIILKKIAPDITQEELQSITDLTYHCAEELRLMV